MIKKVGVFLLLLSSITIINSESQNITIGELRVLKETLYNASVYMQKEAQYEDIAIFIGTTKSGKSTLINYLMGNPLIAKQKRVGSPITIEKADNSSGPSIGKKSTSETKIPSRWTSKHFPNMSLWDSAGFNDNRGPWQDITNAFYRYQLLRKVKSLKFILVVDITAIKEDNIISFMNILTALESLMQDKMRDCFASISVIFSKAPIDYYGTEVNKAFIKDLLKENILESEGINISPVSRDFVEFLINNEKNLGIFRKVDKLDNITSSIDVDIIPAILNSVPLQKNIIQEMKPSISENSKSWLTKLQKTIFSNKNFEDLQTIVRNTLENKINYYNSVNFSETSGREMNNFKQELNNFENQLFIALNHCERLHEKIEILRKIVLNIYEQFEEHNLNEKIKLEAFVGAVMKKDKNIILDSSLNTILWSSIAKIQHVSCSQISGDWKMNVTGGIINFKNINIDQCDKDVKFLEIFAAQKVIINYDLMFIGRKVQITIIAPVWEIVGTRTIALNGRDGLNHTNLRADNVTTFESNGIDGLPGLPGESAGNFYGVALEIINGEKLIILANGGRGGNGQHGGNGGYFGGNGGAKGQGGYKGSVLLYELSKNNAVSSATNQTLTGNDGDPGYGGLAGIRYSTNCVKKAKCSRNACSVNVDDCDHGPNFEVTNQFKGHSGTNLKDYKHPNTVPIVQNLKHSVNEYKTYVTSKLEIAFQYHNLKSFYDLLNTKGDIIKN